MEQICRRRTAGIGKPANRQYPSSFFNHLPDLYRLQPICTFVRLRSEPEVHPGSQAGAPMFLSLGCLSKEVLVPFKSSIPRATITYPDINPAPVIPNVPP
jgi:hypothetical protein